MLEDCRKIVEMVDGLMQNLTSDGMIVTDVNRLLYTRCVRRRTMRWRRNHGGGREGWKV